MEDGGEVQPMVSGGLDGDRAFVMRAQDIEVKGETSVAAATTPASAMDVEVRTARSLRRVHFFFSRSSPALGPRSRVTR